MRAIPGRKSVVFFSEGLSITSNVKARFTSVIAAANRANVEHLPDGRRRPAHREHAHGDRARA